MRHRILILNIVRAFTFLSLAWMLSGCGEQEITGQVFVVTQGKNNIKLALVNVGAIPQEEFDPYLKAKQSKKLEQQQLLYPKYKQAKSELPEHEKMYTFLEGNKKYLDIKRLKEDEKFLGEYKVRMDEAKALITKYEAFDKAEFLFEGLPLTKAISKTDADGKFTLSLPKGKYVIAANSDRKVVGSLETYHWLVLVDSSSPNQKLMLSNDNLLETKCNECVKLQ